MNLKEHSIDTSIGKVVCYRLRTNDEEWKKLEGQASFMFERGAKRLRVFYPDEAGEAPFYISDSPYTYRRGIVWHQLGYELQGLATYKVRDIFLEKKNEEKAQLYEYYGNILLQLSFLERQ